MYYDCSLMLFNVNVSLLCVSKHIIADIIMAVSAFSEYDVSTVQILNQHDVITL